MTKPMSDEEFEKELKAQKWTFAKTYAKTAPHEYFLKKDNPRLFAEIARRIKESGKEGKFYNTTFRYYYFGPHKYWAYEDLVNRDSRTAKYEAKS